MTRRTGASAAEVVFAIAFALGVIALLASLLSGCGASALKAHAIAADRAAVIVNGAGDEIRTERRRQQEEAIDAAQYREDAAAAVTAIRERWAPILAAHEAVRRAHDVWVATLALAAAGELEEPDRWAAIARATVLAYDELVTVAELVDLELPELPPVVVEVARATGGGS